MSSHSIMKSAWLDFGSYVDCETDIIMSYCDVEVWSSVPFVQPFHFIPEEVGISLWSSARPHRFLKRHFESDCLAAYNHDATWRLVSHRDISKYVGYVRHSNPYKLNPRDFHHPVLWSYSIKIEDIILLMSWRLEMVWPFTDDKFSRYEIISAAFLYGLLPSEQCSFPIRYRISRKG